MNGLPAEALVLAAGEGRRLRPATDATPKPLVPFLNVPLLEHVLRRLAAAGIRRVLLNAWHRADDLVRFADAAPVPGLDIEVFVEDQLLGTGGGIAALARHVESDSLLVLAGDVLADFDLPALAARHRASGAAATMALTPRPDPSRYGPCTIDDAGRLIDIARLLGRPDAPAERTFVNASAHLLERDFVDILPSTPSCLVRQGYVPAMTAGLACAGWVHGGRWEETGTPQALVAAQEHALRGLAPVDAELLARGGALRPGPALVASDARVAEDALLLDGTTVGARALVGRGARLRRCLVLPGAEVAPGADLTETLVCPVAAVA